MTTKTFRLLLVLWAALFALLFVVIVIPPLIGDPDLLAAPAEIVLVHIELEVLDLPRHVVIVSHTPVIGHPTAGPVLRTHPAYWSGSDRPPH